MEQFCLTEIETKDNLVLQGLYAGPRHQRGTALLWIHGLSSEFYSDLAVHEAFAKACEKKGWGYAAFNNRGHSLICAIQKLDSKEKRGYLHYPAGAGQERFYDCVSDIDAGINFLIRQGFKKVYLVGHSTGSNKACYYAGKIKDSRVGGVVLTGPVSDRLGEEKTNPNTAETIAFMKKRIREGKGDTLLFGYHFFPLTPKRYLSLFDKDAVEDVFDYGEKKPKMRWFSNIHKPLYVILAGNDEYADRTAQEMRKVFDAYANSMHYKSEILPDCTHGFEGRETILVRKIVNWIVHT